MSKSDVKLYSEFEENDLTECYKAIEEQGLKVKDFSLCPKLLQHYFDERGGLIVTEVIVVKESPLVVKKYYMTNRQIDWVDEFKSDLANSVFGNNDGTSVNQIEVSTAST